VLNKVWVLIILYLCLGSHQVAAEGIQITIMPEAKVEGNVLTLGQIAQISGDDKDWVDSLRQLKLGNSPTAGNSIVLTKELITMRLAAAGSNFSGIVWQIPDAVTVTTNSQTVNADGLRDKALMTIKQQIGNNVDQADLMISPVGSLQDVVAPVGNVQVTASLPYGIRYNAPTIVSLTMTVDGQVVGKIPLGFNVQLYGQVVVASQPVSFGEGLTQDNIRYERMDIGRLAAGYYTSKDKLVGLLVRRSLTPGMVITDALINKPLLIKQGDMVNIVAQIGGMEVVVAGKAMQNGNEGQLIRVQNINSAKVILAKVLNGSTVEVLTYNGRGN